MQSANYQLILIEPNGNYAIPDIVISDQFETAFSIQSAADISQRKDNLSKNITFPGTKNNNRILNNLYSFNRESDATLEEVLFSNYSPSIGVRATLYENSELIISGILKINDIKRDGTGGYTYVGIITGNLVGFFNNIKDLKLQDLPAFDQEITFSESEIITSWAFDDSDLYLYPQIDYGKGIVPNRATFDVRNFRPAIYARHYISGILSSQGYKYASQFLDSDYFKRAFIPFAEAEFGNVVFGNVATGAGTAYSIHMQDNGDNTDGAGMKLTSFTDTPLITRAPDTRIWFTSDTPTNENVDFYADTFTLNRFASVGARITFDYDLASSQDSGAGKIKLSQVINGRVGKGEFIDAGATIAYTGDNHYTGTITLRLPYQSYPKGFTFAVWVESTILGGTTDMTFSNISIEIGNPDAAIGSFFALEYGDVYNLRDVVPKEQKAVEFLRSLLQFFNLYMIENPDDDRELIIEPYDTFYNRTITPAGNATDWTKKIDQESLHIKINTALPKTYHFKFKEDGDYYNTLYKNTWGGTYGDFSIDNRIGSAEPKTVDVIFSPTVVVKESVDDKTLPAIFDGDIFSKKSLKSNLRILYNNGVGACERYSFVLTYPGDVPTYEEVSTGHTLYNISHHVLTLGGVNLFNLLFGLPRAVYYQVDGNIFDLPTLYSALYKNQIVELNSENIFTLEVDGQLKETDIARLDLRTPIFISTVQGVAYFKIMSVTYYSRDEVSKIVLQKIIL